MERYEDEHWPITTDVDRVSMVRYLLEQGNIKQKDLIPEFGSETAVSLFLSGRRNLTVEQIRKLSARFKLDASIFISAAGAGAGAYLADPAHDFQAALGFRSRKRAK